MGCFLFAAGRCLLCVVCMLLLSVVVSVACGLLWVDWSLFFVCSFVLVFVRCSCLLVLVFVGGCCCLLMLWVVVVSCLLSVACCLSWLLLFVYCCLLLVNGVVCLGSLLLVVC